ncbi:MAG TPA: hypothetical protein VMV27_14550 [Candidatus Binataceae bacterium]|nr:hypothetical protein [Candidatus Binataceae bacterium]
MKALRAEWLFFAMLGSFAVIYLALYPATIAIADECEILTLAYSISRGTIHPDVAGVITFNRSMEFGSGAHRVIKYSMFHAAMLTPAIDTNWRLAFLVSAGFLIAGAFAIRSMLRENGLSTDWCALYFLLPGMLYYASTLEAAVPAAVMGLVGVAMLVRPKPRAVLGGLALGAAVLLHPWMLVTATAFAAVWSVERIASGRAREVMWLALGAAPSAAALGGYAAQVNGSVLRVNYAMTGEVYLFTGAHLREFLPFYIASLGIFPIAGWAALSPRCARGWAAPVTVAAIVIGASLYDFRDGLTSGLHGAVALIAGAIPGQRFLLPASLLACTPAARWLDARRVSLGTAWTNRSRAMALTLFVIGYAIVGTMHQSYLRAHAVVQSAIARALPERARLVGNGDLLKELAPVFRIVDYRAVDGAEAAAASDRQAYAAWLGAPGAAPPAALFAGRPLKKVEARSWVWNRDLWIGGPVVSGAAGSREADRSPGPSPSQANP